MVATTAPAKQNSIHVLHVDDDEAFLETVRLCLERTSDKLSITTTTETDAVLEYLDCESVDCVVSDYEMPQMNGLELLCEVRDCSDVPFILFTGREYSDLSGAAFADDKTTYFQKGWGTACYDELADKIRRLVETA